MSEYILCKKKIQLKYQYISTHDYGISTNFYQTITLKYLNTKLTTENVLLTLVRVGINTKLYNVIILDFRIGNFCDCHVA